MIYEVIVSPKIWTKNCKDVPHFRAEILTIFGSYFGKNDDFIYSFRNLLIFNHTEIRMIFFLSKERKCGNYQPDWHILTKALTPFFYQFFLYVCFFQTRMGICNIERMFYISKNGRRSIKSTTVFESFTEILTWYHKKYLIW